VQRHLRGLECLLLLGELVPGDGPVDLAGAEPPHHRGRRGIGRADLPLDFGESAGDQAQPLDPLPALVTNDIPSRPVPVAHASDILWQSVQREMRRAEREIEEERLVGGPGGVVLQVLERVLRDGGRHVVARPGLNGRQPDVVLMEDARVEVAACVLDVVRMVEAATQGHAIDVPLAAMVRPIAATPEQFGQEFGPGWSGAINPASHARHRIAPDLLGVVARQDRRAARPAPRRVVELRVP
jgi:hypothetical protein